MGDVPSVELTNGVHMPQVGLGLAGLPGDQVAEVVGTAIETGYRNFDAYGAEVGVGQALARADVPRHELFVTTGSNAVGYDALHDFDAGLGRLGLEYVDLYLVHQPVDDFVQTWKAFEKLAADGRVRAIGVAGFRIPHLRRLSEETSTVPAVNQIAVNPASIQGNLRAYHSEHGIVTEAVNPLGDIADNDDIDYMAQKYGKTPAQIILRWHMELNHVALNNAALHGTGRLRADIEIFDFELADDDVLTLSELDTNP
ncbi:MAG: aldo/keto reductase [Kibdelosporangium sp.]